jgi:hypothetical protein
VWHASAGVCPLSGRRLNPEPVRRDAAGGCGSKVHSALNRALLSRRTVGRTRLETDSPKHPSTAALAGARPVGPKGACRIRLRSCGCHIVRKRACLPGLVRAELSIAPAQSAAQTFGTPHATASGTRFNPVVGPRRLLSGGRNLIAAAFPGHAGRVSPRKSAGSSPKTFRHPGCCAATSWRRAP